MCPTSKPGNSNMCRNGPPAAHTAHSHRELPPAARWGWPSCHPQPWQLLKPNVPPWSLQRRPAIAVMTKLPSGHFLERGIEILQVRSIFRRCMCTYTSVSVSFLKEGKVLPRSYELIRPELPLFSSQGLVFPATVSVLVVTALVYCIFF